MHDSTQDAGLPLVFRPPATQVILAPGVTADLQAEVCTPAERLNPQGRQGTLHLRLTTAHGEPLPLSIPVTARAPSLALGSARQAADQRTIEVEVQNTGQQDIASETVFVADIAGTTLDKVTRQELRAGELITLAFALPETLGLTRDTRLTRSATKLTHPVRE